jgi:precorrin-2 methylase
VIGVGCGDARLITLDAISYMGRSDAFIAPEDLAKRFSKYMGMKPILFDPFSSFEPEFKKRNTGLRADEMKKRLETQREAEMKSLRDTLAAGKSVAVLDYGDPTLYGGRQHWLGPNSRKGFRWCRA